MITKRDVMSLSRYCNKILIGAQSRLRENIPCNASFFVESKSLVNLIESIETEYGVPKWKEFNDDYNVENEKVIHAYKKLRKECLSLGYNPEQDFSGSGDMPPIN